MTGQGFQSPAGAREPLSPSRVPPVQGCMPFRFARVAKRIDRISVFGGLDQVLNGLVTLKAG